MSQLEPNLVNTSEKLLILLLLLLSLGRVYDGGKSDTYGPKTNCLQSPERRTRESSGVTTSVGRV